MQIQEKDNITNYTYVATVWRKTLTVENIDKFVEIPTTHQYFPIKILHLATHQ